MCRCSAVYLLLFDSISFKRHPTFTAQCLGCVIYMYFCIVFVYIYIYMYIFCKKTVAINVLIRFSSSDVDLFSLLCPVPAYTWKWSWWFGFCVFHLCSQCWTNQIRESTKLRWQITHFGDLWGAQNVNWNSLFLE